MLDIEDKEERKRVGDKDPEIAKGAKWRKRRYACRDMDKVSRRNKEPAR